ncbi:MAG: FAD binding domain-containing protein [Xanthobacteraceae bacterium]
MAEAQAPEKLSVIPFEMVEPRSLKEALALLDPQEPAIRPVAGGTALMLMMKAGVFVPSRLVCLHRIEPEYFRIALTAAGELQIGAMASLRDLEQDSNVAARFPMLVHGLRRLSNPRVRNVARVGGALAHGDPHMDLPPLLTALGARVTIQGPDAKRELPLEELYAGYYETVLNGDELITVVTVPALNGRKCAYMKVTSRSADDWPALGVAVAFDLSGGVVRNPTIVVSAATEKVTRMTEAEKVLQDAAPEDALLTRAGEAAAVEASILADAHGSAAYKRELLRVYVGRAVRQALAQETQQVRQ